MAFNLDHLYHLGPTTSGFFRRMQYNGLADGEKIADIKAAGYFTHDLFKKSGYGYRAGYEIGDTIYVVAIDGAAFLIVEAIDHSAGIITVGDGTGINTTKPVITA